MLLEGVKDLREDAEIEGRCAVGKIAADGNGGVECRKVQRRAYGKGYPDKP